MRQAVKFEVSFHASMRKTKFRTFLLLCMSDNIRAPWSCVLAKWFTNLVALRYDVHYTVA